MILKKNYKMKSLEHRKQYKMHKNGKNLTKILKNYIINLNKMLSIVRL
jgi:hypothetical protein